MSLLFVTGDDVAMSFTLYEQSTQSGQLSPVSISSSATVKAVLASPQGFTPYSDEVDVTESHTLSNWGSGIVVVLFESAVSSLVKNYGDASVQVMVDDGGRRTYPFDGIEVVKGQTT